MSSANTDSAYLPQHIVSSENLASLQTNSYLSVLALIWNYFYFSWGEGGFAVQVTHRLIKGSPAFHKGESIQAAAATAKKSTASGKNKTQTRVHCDCYLLLHNKPSHSLGWVSGVQPLSSRPTFDLGVEMRRGLVLSCGDRTTPPPGCSY